MSNSNQAKVNIADQYRELCNDGRHYDQKLWIIPGAAYTLSILFYSAILDPTTEPGGRFLLSTLNTIVFSGFLFQYVKDRAFQLTIQAALDEIGEKEELVPVAQYGGGLCARPKDRWFIRCTRQLSAANYVFYVMLTTLLAHFGVAVYFLVSWLGIIS